MKQGQIAHVDHDATNARFQNLVFLCLPHHDQYDSTTSQAKKFTEEELRLYRNELDAFLKQEKTVPWPDFAQVNAPEVGGGGAPGSLSSPSPPEVYDRRIVIYRTLRSFLVQIIREATVSHEQLGEFAEATNEALFLFNHEVSEYLRQVYSKGVRLYYTSGRIREERLAPKEDYSAIVSENAQVLNWIIEQLEASRVIFRKFLFLG